MSLIAINGVLHVCEKLLTAVNFVSQVCRRC